MAVCQGKDLNDLIITYQTLLDLGYKHIAFNHSSIAYQEMYSTIGSRKPLHASMYGRMGFIRHLVQTDTIDKKYESIIEGDKLFIINLKQNPYNIETIGLPNAKTPPEIEEFIKAYIDVDEIFESLLGNKLKNLYLDLNWEFPSLNSNVKKFFAFN